MLSQQSRTRRPTGLLTMLVLLVAAPLALAGSATVITGQNGHAVECLFDTNDLANLSAWDDPDLGLSFGQIWKWNGSFHSLAADESGYVYAIANGETYSVGGESSSDEPKAVAGVVRGSAASSLETIYSYAYDGGNEWKRPYSLALAASDSDTFGGLVVAGEVLLLSTYSTGILSGPIESTTLIEVFDPSDADNTIRTLYEAESFVGNEMLLDLEHEVIWIPSSAGFARLTYDETLDGIVSTTLALTEGISPSIQGIDNVGNLHVVDEKFDGAIGKFVTTVRIVDSDGSTTAVAYPKGTEYGIHGFTFDAKGKLWLADHKKKKSNPHYLTKANKRGKFPWKKRIADWGSGTDVRILVTGGDGLFYVIARAKDAGGDSVFGVYAID